MKATLYADGASRGNPGPAGAGAYLTNEKGQPLAQVYQKLKPTTNNVAEYQALILGLKKAQEFPITQLAVYLDSQLIVRQIQGAYRVKQNHLIGLYQEALNLLDSFEIYSIEHVPREQNKIADELANRAIDES